MFGKIKLAIVLAFIVTILVYHYCTTKEVSALAGCSLKMLYDKCMEE